jgi:hypothetical protein
LLAAQVALGEERALGKCEGRWGSPAVAVEDELVRGSTAERTPDEIGSSFVVVAGEM